MSRRRTMSNYLNNTNYAVEPAKADSRYSLHEENEQSQWINKVAKQAARLISEQIKIPDNYSKKSN